MLNVGGGEVLMILVIALIFLGPTRLPEAGRQVGKAIAEFRRMTSGVQKDLKDALDMDGVRESIDTFREVVDVRKNLVNEFASAAAHLTSSPSAPVSPATAAAPTPVGDTAIPPPDGMFLGDSPALNPSFASSAPAPSTRMFHDVLMDPPPAPAPSRVDAFPSLEPSAREPSAREPSVTDHVAGD